ncbi:MAG TPA: hypothetical protein PLF40_31260, partial [Kofleriaceae bacterium]|nr:hypothetical protein [Kofleriaceae bacterium]
PAIAGAGFSAGLAGSPFAPGLRDAGIVGPDVEAASFDVRAMFTAALVQAFFRGEYGTVGGSTQEPISDGASLVGIARTLQDFAPTWLTPAPRGRGTEQERRLGSIASPQMPVATPRSAAAATVPSSVSDVAPDAALQRSATAAASTRIIDLSSVGLGSDAYEVIELAVPAEFAASAVSDRDDFANAPVRSDGRVDYRPGAIGRAASAWSVSQQNASTDLTLDFLPPELVVAAQAYGLSPQAALVAARLSAAGPAAIAGLASQVDMAFLQVPARTATINRLAAQANVGTSNEIGDFTPALGPVSSSSTDSSSDVRSNLAQPRWDSMDGLAMANQTISEIAPMRQPRGAFLWPQAASAALGIKGENLANNDGQSQFSVAALEVLAAKAVADLGAYASVAQYDAPASANNVTAVAQRGGQDPRPSIPFVDASRRPELLRGVLRASAGPTAGFKIAQWQVKPIVGRCRNA